MGVHITGGNLSLALHGDGSGKALSAGSRAAVQHPDILLRQLRAQNAQLRRRILYIEQALFEGRQILQIAGTGKHQAVGHPTVGFSGDPLPFQPLQQLGCGDPQSIHLHHRLRRFVIRFQHGLQLSFWQIRLQKGDQLVRMAVAIGIGYRLFQGSLGSYGIAQNAVDQRGHFGVLTIFFCQGDGFVHRGAFRDLIHLIDLVQSQMQNVPGCGMQILQLSGEQLLKVKVQLAPVLLHAVAQSCCQRRVPAVQPVPLDIVLQHAVGPGAVLPAGDQRIQRRLSGAHQLSRGWPRK